MISAKNANSFLVGIFWVQKHKKKKHTYIYIFLNFSYIYRTVPDFEEFIWSTKITKHVIDYYN